MTRTPRSTGSHICRVNVHNPLFFSLAHMQAPSTLDPQPAEPPQLPPELTATIFCRAIGHGGCREVSMEHKQHADAAEQRCVLVADTPIAEIRAHVSRCPHLEHLELAGCVHVDDALVAFLLRLLTRLTTLDVSGCPQITPLSLQALRSWADGAVGRQWRAIGCCMAPSPLLSPVQVVTNQMLALHSNDDKGMAQCFEFASPSNRAVTGPLARFAGMIRTAYGVMCTAKHGWVGEVQVDDEQLDDLLQASILVVYSTCPEGFHPPHSQFLVFCFYLEKQQSERAGYKDCWMTSGVGGPQPLNPAAATRFETEGVLPMQSGTTRFQQVF